VGLEHGGRAHPALLAGGADGRQTFTRAQQATTDRVGQFFGQLLVTGDAQATHLI